MLTVTNAHETSPGEVPGSEVATFLTSWECSCGASGYGDPCECPSCGCESRKVVGVVPDPDDCDPPDPFEYGPCT